MDPDGRYCLVNVNHSFDESISNCITLVNIYAPNNHKESLIFFTGLFELIERFNDSLDMLECPEIVISGDFNFIFDEETDCQNRKVSSDEKQLAAFVTQKLYDLELWDLVQVSKEMINFTWRRGPIRSRIDYIFASSRIAEITNKFTNRWQLINTDHAAIIVELTRTDSNNAGRSYPKLSFNDIKDKKDKEYVSQSIINAKSDFLADWSPHTRLEYVKLMIRSSVLSKRAEKNKEISQLSSHKNLLNDLENKHSLNSDDVNKLTELRSRIDKLE